MSTPDLTLRMDATGTAFRAAPTWTTYTSSLIADSLTITWGRQDEQSEPQPAECSFELENADGRWTPGNASAPSGWTRGARVNVRVTVGGTTYDRFDGYVDSVEPTWPGGVQSWSVVKVTATDVTARLGRQVPLRSMLEEEMLADGAVALYPLSETSESFGSLVSAEAATLEVSKYGPGTVDLSKPDVGPIGATGLGLSSADSDTVAGYNGTAQMTWLKIPNPLTFTAPWSLEFWFTGPTVAPGTADTFILANLGVSTASPQVILYYPTAPPGLAFYVTGGSGGSSALVYSGFVTYVGSLTPTAPAHVVATLESDKRTIKLYVNGVLRGSNTAAGDLSPLSIVGDFQAGGYGGSAWNGANGSYGPLTGTLADIGFYQTALTAAQVLAHYEAGAGTLVESSDLRYSRVAGYGNVTTSGLPSGVATMGQQETAGRSVVDVLAEVARTEGTVSYATGAGALTFQARNARYNANASVTLTADDIDPPTVRIDGQGVMNQLAVTRSGGAERPYVNTAAQTADGIADGGSFTVAPSTDYDALQNAAWQVETHLDPQVRIPSLKVNLLRQTDTSKIQTLMAAGISSLVTVSSLPANAPATSASLFIEGATEVIGLSAWSIEFFTSPNLPYTTLRADAAASTYTKLDNGLKIPF